MTVTMCGYAGRAYLEKVTEAMIRFRGEGPLVGHYDAGDLNWWWRDGNYGDAANQVFWEDEAGGALGFVLLSKAYRNLDYEFLPSLGEGELAREMFCWGLDRLRALAEQGQKPWSLALRPDQPVFCKLVEDAGFVPQGQVMVQTALELPAPHPGFEPPEGFRVRSLRPADLVAGGTPVLHQKAESYRRFTDTPLYRQDFHLVVESPEGRLGAECIIWLDETNGIGTFEPVRTHPDFYQQGLGKAMLSEGLKRMTERGIELAKVCTERDNLAARRLYASLGFRPVFEKHEFVFSPDTP